MFTKTIPLEVTVEKGGWIHLDIPSDLPEGAAKLRVTVDNVEGVLPTNNYETLSIEEILRLPVREQQRIMEEAALAMEEGYRTNRELTAFEAFGEDDFFDETP